MNRVKIDLLADVQSTKIGSGTTIWQLGKIVISMP